MVGPAEEGEFCNRCGLALLMRDLVERHIRLYHNLGALSEGKNGSSQPMCIRWGCSPSERENSSEHIPVKTKNGFSIEAVFLMQINGRIVDVRFG